MTRLVVDIASDKDLNAVLALLKNLHIPYTKKEEKARERRKELIAIIDQGAEIDNFDAFIKNFEESRKDKPLPGRE